MQNFDQSYVRVCIVVVYIVFTSFFATSPVFGQTEVETSAQTIISKDLENNPVAHDILKKIEQTKNGLRN